MAIGPDTHGPEARPILARLEHGTARILLDSGRHGHDIRAVPGPQSRPIDASKHGPKKGGPIGPMGSTIGLFKYYVIHYQILFKYFRAAGPNGPARPE